MQIEIAESDRQTDGRFYAKDGKVHRAPIEVMIEGGTQITVGFPVCTMTEYAGKEGAEAIARSLNLALDKGVIK